VSDNFQCDSVSCFGLQALQATFCKICIREPVWLSTSRIQPRLLSATPSLLRLSGKTFLLAKTSRRAHAGNRNRRWRGCWSAARRKKGSRDWRSRWVRKLGTLHIQASRPSTPVLALARAVLCRQSTISPRNHTTVLWDIAEIFVWISPCSSLLRRLRNRSLLASAFQFLIFEAIPPLIVVLFPKPLEPVSHFRASFSFVREFGDEQRERLGVSRDP